MHQKENVLTNGTFSDDANAALILGKIGLRTDTEYNLVFSLVNYIMPYPPINLAIYPL
jgi:hypothetical protein